MDGPPIPNFSLRLVPALVDSVLRDACLHFDDIDPFLAHQANEFMLKHLRDKFAIPAEKFPIEMDGFENTVSSPVPMTLARLDQRGLLVSGMKIMIFGFGVGLSRDGSVITWR